ncbi:MAG: hypothetical protein ACKVOM_14480 [Ferruginibacter sp.]
MKTLSKLSFAIILCVCGIASVAQVKDARQKLYADFPQTINVDKNTFTNVLQTAVGSNVSLSLTNDFIFRGTVIGNFTKYNNLSSVANLFLELLHQTSHILCLISTSSPSTPHSSRQ